jgi:hypothetical protein
VGPLCIRRAVVEGVKVFVTFHLRSEGLCISPRIVPTFSKSTASAREIGMTSPLSCRLSEFSLWFPHTVPGLGRVDDMRLRHPLGDPRR